MPSLLSKIFKKNLPDAEIVGDANFHPNNMPYFVVKMHGCKTLVNINAEDIIENFVFKFSQLDIKKATKVFMKYRGLLKLISIEKNIAILHNDEDKTYQFIDLTEKEHFPFDKLKPEDAFTLGIYFERIRSKKDTNLLKLSKSGNNIKQFTVVKNEKE